MIDSRLCLDHLTVRELSPDRLVEVAAAAGYGAVAPWFYAPVNADPHPLAVEGRSRDRLRALARNLGIAIPIMGPITIDERFERDVARSWVEAAAQIGCPRLLVVVFDFDRGRARDALAWLVASARAVQIRVCIEFIAFSAIPNLQAALDLLKAIGDDTGGLVLDPLHLCRSGGSPKDLAVLDPARIGYAQICDGLLIRNDDDDTAEAAFHRLPPGEGAFPLADFVGRLPDHCPVGIEVPLARGMLALLPPLERAVQLRQAAQAIFAVAARPLSR